MAIKVLAEKVLEVQKATPNLDKATVKAGGFLSFPEKHYLPKGAIPADAVIIKCRYYVELPDEA